MQEHTQPADSEEAGAAIGCTPEFLAQMPCMGSRWLLKIKAHQAEKRVEEETPGRPALTVPMTDEEFREAASSMAPNAFAVDGNSKADREANEARRIVEAGGRRAARYCAGGERFFLTWQGRMVLGSPGKFVRAVGQEAALDEWAKRPAQGAVARAVKAGEVDGASLEIGRFRSAVETGVLPAADQPGQPGHPFCPDRVLWKMRNYVGGSWTAFLHTGLFNPADPEAVPGRRKPVGEQVTVLARCMINLCLRTCQDCDESG